MPAADPTHPETLEKAFENPGDEAVAAKGWLGAHRWLLTRRAVQVGLLLLFLTGPLIGVRITEGTLASSLTLDVLPLTDPLILLQAFVAGQAVTATALIGAVIVFAAYAILGGRLFCSWVCPVNVVTDAAHWLHQRLKIEKGWQPHRATRYWILGTILVVSGITGTIAWEEANPVTVLHRGIVFGTLFAGFGWTLLLAIFLFDAVVSRRGWCGHICPVGAFYGLMGTKSVLKVSAHRRDACDSCMDCFAVCPEPHVISPALKPRADDQAATPIITSSDCTTCGRCIDVCAEDVFRFTRRGDTRTIGGPYRAPDHAPHHAPDRTAHEAASASL